MNPHVFPKPRPRGCDPRASEPRLVYGVPLDMGFAQLRVTRTELRPWDGAVTSEPESSGAYYPVDERTLPPGIDPNEIVTIAHLRDGAPFGGVSYRV